MDEKLADILGKFSGGPGRITALTGAGISAESGIPTFRGPEGYWTVGSRNYHPQEMATNRMFQEAPDEVWRWYLYRMNVCADAEPNAGHFALVEMEKFLGDRFVLITQNVDGLHLRAGNTPERTYMIHGNVYQMRCAESCAKELFPLPDAFRGRDPSAPLTGAERERLTCPKCGGWTRPHVLWFDEMYDEAYFRFESSLRAAAQTDLLLVVGTSGVTNLPNQVAMVVARKKGLVVDVNIAENPFSELALRSGGYFLRQSA
ncbi:MAG: SIR2 family NAD-dependent protein deacylase, partial [Desulfococcaceae bacterium]